MVLAEMYRLVAFCTLNPGDITSDLTCSGTFRPFLWQMAWRVDIVLGRPLEIVGGSLFARRWRRNSANLSA